MRNPTTKRQRLMYAIKHMPNLVAYYPLNEVEGIAAKNYALSNLSVIGNSTLVTVKQAGKVGRAYNFDGVSSLILVTPDVVNLSVFTYVALIYFAGGVTATIRGDTKGSGTRAPQFRVVSDGTLELLEQGVASMATSTQKVNLNAWNLVAVTYDASGNYAFYINGIVSGTGTNLRGFQFGDMWIGQSANPSEIFNGNMQHFAAIERAINASELRKLAHRGGFI